MLSSQIHTFKEKALKIGENLSLLVCTYHDSEQNAERSQLVWGQSHLHCKALLRKEKAEIMNKAEKKYCIEACFQKGKTNVKQIFV